MSATYKPEGYSTVSPYLVVNGAAETIDFLIDVFDATELRRFPAENGGLVHAEVRLDDTVIMLADSNDSFAAAPSHVHVYVEDVNRIYQQAVEAGARSVQEPRQQSEEEDRRAAVQDSGGTTWWIATKVTN